MGDGSYTISSFQGGEWSPFAQGQIAHPKYKTALNVCFNSLPLEQGAHARRPGTRFAATTRNGAPGRVIDFSTTENTPYDIELTAGHLRIFNSANLVLNTDAVPIVSVSADTPAIMSVVGNPNWATGTQIQLLFNSVVYSGEGGYLRNRQFVVTQINPQQYSLADPVTGLPVNGSLVNWVATDIAAQAASIVDFATPYTGELWSSVRSVQAATVGPNNSSLSLLLQATVAPQALFISPNPNAPQFAPFTFTPASFTDGPYLDPVPGSIATPSALSGEVNIVISSTAWSSTTTYAVGDFVSYGGFDYASLVDGNINNTPSTSPTDWAIQSPGGAAGVNGFQTSDIGRLMRFLSEPLPWAVGTSYSAGDAVSFNGAYYVASVNNSGSQPDINLADWAPTDSQTVFTWTWGRITAINAANSVTVILLGANLLYTTTIFTWRLGVYSQTTGYPTCGTYYEGRLWLSGVVGNRCDSSVSDDVFNFAPTAPDGTVGDANGISAVFDSDDVNPIFWMTGNELGIVCGTLAGEWVIQASSLQDPITPTSIQAHRRSKYGCANILPVHTPLTICFVQKAQQQVFEYFADVFSQKMVAPSLSAFAKHLTTSGIAELAYQQEFAPVVWGRVQSGTLLGCTYRRTSAFSNEEPNFVGWHHHALGSGRETKSITMSPSANGFSDALTMTTMDPTTGIYWVEILTDLLTETSTLTDAWFVDAGVTPGGMTVAPDQSSMTLYGYWHLNGQTVSVVIGGLDCGDFPVVNGMITLPFQTDPGKLMTFDYLASISGDSFGALSTSLDQLENNTPAPPPTGDVVTAMIPNGPNVAQPISTPIGAPDWLNNNLVIGTTGFNAGAGLAVMNTITGLQEVSASAGTIFSGGPASTSFIQNPIVRGLTNLDSNIYLYSSTSNVGILRKINPVTLAITGSFGTNATGPIRTSSVGIADPFSMAPTHADNNYMVIDGNGGSIGVVNTDTMQDAGHYFQITESFGACCPGGGLGQSGFAYTLGRSNSVLTQTHLYCTTIAFGANTYVSPPLWSGSINYSVGTVTMDPANGLYYIAVQDTNHGGSFATFTKSPGMINAAISVLGYIAGGVANLDKQPSTNPSWWQPANGNPFISTVNLGQVTAAQIDPTWAHISEINGPILDQTDGNIIAFFQNANDAVVHKTYVCKISVASAEVLWATPINAMPIVEQSMWQSRILGFTYAFTTGSSIAANTYPFYVINTQTGAIIQEAAIYDYSLHANGGQTFDAGRGVMIVNADYTFSASPASPTQGPNTPAAFTGQWSTFTMGGLFQGESTAVSRLSIPAVAGYTFTSQAQIVRPQDPQMIGAANGPGPGKTRRSHMFTALIAAGIYGTIAFGTVFSKLRGAYFKTKGLTPIPTNQLFSGTHWDTLEDDYSFDSMLCWQVTRPLTATIASVGGFINTQDR